MFSYKSEEWRILRIAALRRDRWRCVVCGIGLWGKGKSRVDHIVPVSVNPRLALVLTNVRSLCSRCDNQSHREKGGHNSTTGRTNSNYRNAGFSAFGTDGWPVEQS